MALDPCVFEPPAPLTGDWMAIGIFLLLYKQFHSQAPWRLRETAVSKAFQAPASRQICFQEERQMATQQKRKMVVLDDKVNWRQ